MVGGGQTCFLEVSSSRGEKDGDTKHCNSSFFFLLSLMMSWLVNLLQTLKISLKSYKDD